jgi:hypothetical protein
MDQVANPPLIARCIRQEPKVAPVRLVQQKGSPSLPQRQISRFQTPLSQLLGSGSGAGPDPNCPNEVKIKFNGNGKSRAIQNLGQHGATLLSAKSHVPPTPSPPAKSDKSTFGQTPRITPETHLTADSYHAT